MLWRGKIDKIAPDRLDLIGGVMPVLIGRPLNPHPDRPPSGNAYQLMGVLSDYRERLIGRIKDSMFAEGRVGLYLGGKGNAVFNDLLVEEFK